MHHNYPQREALKADVKEMLTYMAEMNERKRIGSEVQLAHPRNSVRGRTVSLRREAGKF